MNNVSAHDDYNLKLLYELSSRTLYKPPSYTCITEFTNSFPKKKVDEFVTTGPDIKLVFRPDAPYPRIYTKNYRKSVLTSIDGESVP
jgi:hypothetical protein